MTQQSSDYIERLRAAIHGSVVFPPASRRAWTAHHEYPGYIALTHPRLPSVTLLMTPDHGEPNTVEWYVDIDGHTFDSDERLSGEIQATWSGDLDTDLSVWRACAADIVQQVTPILNPVATNRRIRKFRRDCVESLVGNTCDNIHDTGNSIDGVSVSETAAYYLVRASYLEGDIEDVALELSETADRVAPDFEFGDSTDVGARAVERAGEWDEEDIKTDVVAQLRSMTMSSKTREVLLRCSDVIEGLFDDSNPWPEMNALLDDINAALKGT